MIMGETAEVLAENYKISREEQDEFAVESHRRATVAGNECHFKEEIVPVTLTDKKGNVTILMKDEHVRQDASLAGMAKLPPVFNKTGTVSAGNSSGITDGASALVLASEEKVRELNLKPIARIVDATIAAVDPRVMGIGPVPAMHNLTKRTERNRDYDAVELNEAFAAQALACDRDIHFNRERLNPNGGAIALGHPIACTGTRIATTLFTNSALGLGTGPRPAQGLAGGALLLCVCPADWAWRSKSKRSKLSEDIPASKGSRGPGAISNASTSRGVEVLGTLALVRAETRRFHFVKVRAEGDVGAPYARPSRTQSANERMLASLPWASTHWASATT